MRQRLIPLVLIVSIITLAACNGQTLVSAPISKQPTVNQPAKVQPTALSSQSSKSQSNSQTDITKSDAQGAVTVDVTPENLENPGDTLIFDVAMNTHSVDLSMDLAQLAVLSTDNGKSVQATLWDAPQGGHHLEGQLSFPSTLDGNNLLDGAKSVTLTITNVDAPARIFTWQLTS